MSCHRWPVTQAGLLGRLRGGEPQGSFDADGPPVDPRALGQPGEERLAEFPVDGLRFGPHLCGLPAPGFGPLEAHRGPALAPPHAGEVRPSLGAADLLGCKPDELRHPVVPPRRLAPRSPKCRKSPKPAPGASRSTRRSRGRAPGVVSARCDAAPGGPPREPQEFEDRECARGRHGAALERR